MTNTFISKTFLWLGVLGIQSTFGQNLKPGFDKAEYLETLKINQKAHIDTNNWIIHKEVPNPRDFKFVYRSPVSGLDNLWDLWINDNVALISIRGSVPTKVSFLANLYAGMVAAKGELILEKDFIFKYNLTNNPCAAVHVGWLISMAYLSRDILPKIDSCYKSGIKEFILTGHSQGGGITFLLTSYLENLKSENRIPNDIRFKTYCSAGPKPGNLFYAYEYENMTREGWAINVVNTADWVPDIPFTVQNISDFTRVNPFTGAKAIIRKQKFYKRWALRYVYNRLSNPSRKAQKNYQKYLGNMMAGQVKKHLPSFVPPQYYGSNYYVRTGETLVLYADEDYFKIFSNDPNNPNIWQHHLPVPYLYLAEKLK